MRMREIAGQQTRFYQRSAYSTWTLATGNTGYDFFANSEASTLRNYNLGQNIFYSNRGALLGLQASIYGASYAAITDITSATYGDIATALNQIITQATITISLDSEPNHIAMLSDLIKPLPILIEADQFGTASNVAKPVVPYALQDNTMYNRDANVQGMWFSPPIIVDFGRNLSFKLSLPSGVSVAAVANNYIIQLKAVLEEYPNVNLAEVRQ